MPHLAWTKGGEADVRALQDDKITVVSSTPHAPGARVDGRLASGSEVRMKVHRCRRTDAGAFEIEGRLLDVTREVRTELRQLVPANASDGKLS